MEDQEGHKPYVVANLPIFQKFGGRVLVRGGSLPTAIDSEAIRSIGRQERRMFREQPRVSTPRLLARLQ
jgi:hypothetical protein